MNFVKTILVLILYVVCLTTKGQHDFGVKINGGWSKISTEINSSSQLLQKFRFMPSYQGGLIYNFNFNNKSIIGAELLFSKITGKEHSEEPTIDKFGSPTNQLITTDIDRNISYLSIPIYYGYNYKKLHLNFGIQTSFAIVSDGLAKTSAPDSNGNMLYFESKSEKLPIKNFDFGVRVGVCFSLTKSFILESTYYYGLLNIHKVNSTSWKWSTQQFTVGIKYNIIAHK